MIGILRISRALLGILAFIFLKACLIAAVAFATSSADADSDALLLRATLSFIAFSIFVLSRAHINRLAEIQGRKPNPLLPKFWTL